MLIAITGLRVRRLPITLLDEPSNNLDRAGKAMLAELIKTWPGTLVVVSHDLDLLDLMDQTAELYDGRLTVFGGSYTRWRENSDRQQAAAVQAMQAAEHAVKAERRQRDEAESKLAKRTRTAKTANENKRGSKILMNGLASRARSRRASSAPGSTTGSSRRARPGNRGCSRATRSEDEPQPPRPRRSRSRRIAELHGTNRSFTIQGPERIALAGLNGVGKTTLVENLLGLRATDPGRATGTLHTDRVGYLSQRLDGLDEGATALENIRLVASGVGDAQIRNQLGRLLFKGATSADPPRRSPAANDSASLSRGCCSPTHQPSCSYWTNRRTTWTW